MSEAEKGNRNNSEIPVDPISVKIRFTGLCTFVKRPDGKGYKVLMVDGRSVKNSSARSDDSALEGPMHLSPLLLFDHGDLDFEGCQRRPDLTFEGQCGDTVRDSLCFLDNEDLRLVVRSGKLLSEEFTVEDRPLGDAIMPRRSDYPFSFDWMIKAEDLVENAEIKRACLEDDPSDVAARVDLDLGNLYVEEFLRYKYKRKRRTASLQRAAWVYPEGQGVNRRKRCVALVATCQVDFDKSEPVVVGLESSRWPGGPRRPFLFKKVEKSLEVEFWNVPFVDVARCWGNRSWRPKPKFGESLQHHYALLKDPGPMPKFERHWKGTKALRYFAAAGKDIGCSPNVALWPTDEGGDFLQE